jgi:hypothetical protein
LYYWGLWWSAGLCYDCELSFDSWLNQMLIFVQGATPVTLAEFDYAGGSDGSQIFYDISLVDGYNIPLAIVLIPGDNPKTKDIPPNLTNAACIATAGWLAPPTDSGLLGNLSVAAFPNSIRTENDQRRCSQMVSLGSSGHCTHKAR